MAEPYDSHDFVIWISVTGSDSTGAGTWNNPFKTVPKAMAERVSVAGLLKWPLTASIVVRSKE